MEDKNLEAVDNAMETLDVENYEVTELEPEDELDESYGLSTGVAMLIGGAIVAGGMVAWKYGRKGISWIRGKIADEKARKNGFVDGDFVDLDDEEESEPTEEKETK